MVFIFSRVYESGFMGYSLQSLLKAPAWGKNLMPVWKIGNPERTDKLEINKVIFNNSLV